MCVVCESVCVWNVYPCVHHVCPCVHGMRVRVLFPGRSLHVKRAFGGLSRWLLLTVVGIVRKGENNAFLELLGSFKQAELSNQVLTRGPMSDPELIAATFAPGTADLRSQREAARWGLSQVILVHASLLLKGTM